MTEEEVDRTDIVKGYSVGRGRYVTVTPDELKAIVIEATHTARTSRRR